MIEDLHTGMAFAVVSRKAGLGRAGIGGMRAGCQGSHLWGFFPPREQVRHMGETQALSCVPGEGVTFGHP